jgi:primary-amine oxidase
MLTRRLFWVGCAALLLIGPVSPPIPQPNRVQAADEKDPRLVEWEGWKFRWSIHPRAGLVLNDVSFRGRKVLKYAGLAEIFVPYNRGQPRPEDFGGGIGNRLQELFPGKDCSPNSVGCQAFNREGKADGKRVVMMHEESTGLSYIGNNGRAYGKMLTLWCAYDLGGYFYLSQWRFRDDGCLMPYVGLTGPLQHTSVGGEPSAYGSVVGKTGKGDTVFAPSHVHNIYFCLDFDIDGEKNVVEEFNYQLDKPGSPSATHSWTPILKETSRSASSEGFRSWRVVNRESKNALGLPRSYEIIPGGNGIFRGSESEKYAQAELWVTRYHENEYPNEKRSLRAALPSYLNDESVDGEDIVVWYVVHVHHLPRTEDHPGMPVEWVGFTLKPRDFLDASPVTPK